MYRSTPIGPLMSEAGLIPAEIMLNERQRKYAHRLLTLLDGHPTKDILPVSLRLGDGSAQPGEIPENDEIWSLNQRVKTLGQQLARQVSVNFSIDLAEGVEPVIHVKPAEFSGRIIIQELKLAINEAKTGLSDLILWSDGSKLQSGGAGAAVVWKDSLTQGWNTCKSSLGKNKEILDAELWGISEALKIALKESILRKARKITVYSDSQLALKQLQGSKNNAGQALSIQIFKQAKQLHAQGRELIVRWIPSHRGFSGNELADKAAKEAAANERCQTAGWSSLTHVNRKIKEVKKLEVYTWHQARNEEREARSRSYFIPRLKPGINPVLAKASKKYASRFFQLKIGHAAVGVFLARIGAVDTAECWWCGKAEQSVVHLYAECRKWRKERKVLKKELQQVGIRWQCRTENRWLAKLLANEQAITPLLKYLMTTEVGGRGGEMEKEAEWEQRADQEGEGDKCF